MRHYRTIVLDITAGIARIRFNRDKDTNAFSREMTRELLDACRHISADAESAEPQVGALILTGGRGRSFSVGGDFNDVSRLSEAEEIRDYLSEIVDLYIALLDIDVPVIAAIDRFAIGQGLQVATMADWRIGAHTCRLQMPELKNGVACPLGSVILEALLGRARMQELVFGCELLDATAGRVYGLISEIVPAGDLQSAAVIAAKRFIAYPRTPFTATKRIHNLRLITALQSIKEDTIRAHVAALLQRTGQAHFDRILNANG